MTSGLPVNGEGIPPNGPHVPAHPTPVMGNALQAAVQKPGGQGRTRDKPHLGMVRASRPTMAQVRGPWPNPWALMQA